jgi:hypothetical protein
MWSGEGWGRTVLPGNQGCPASAECIWRLALPANIKSRKHLPRLALQSRSLRKQPQR